LTAGTISSKTAKELFPDMVGSGRTADEFIAERGLMQLSDEGAIRTMVDDVIRANPDNLTKYLDGKSNLFGFFVGQVLKASGGSANPSLVSSIMKEALDSLNTQTRTED
jgi:Asp-tRNA(Asn)/Glu-tRNA(Gln) amidotransferase B subunit